MKYGPEDEVFNREGVEAEAVCRGTFMLGTACGTCPRCKQNLTEIKQATGLRSGLSEADKDRVVKLTKAWDKFYMEGDKREYERLFFDEGGLRWILHRIQDLA